MFQDQLPYDQGMIFVFTDPGLYSLWMLNMQFPLDMIWFDQDGNVVHIEKCSSMQNSGRNNYLSECGSR